MLSCFDAALRVKGRKIAAIARDMEMTPSTLHGWFSGRAIVPDRKRGRLEEAMGARVDWSAYAQQIEGKETRKRLPPAPARPAQAPQAAPAAPVDVWGAPPPPRPAQAPQAAPAAPAAPRRGFLAGLIRDDEAEGLGA